MTIINTLTSVTTSLGSLADAEEAVQQLDFNQRKINSNGLGNLSSMFTIFRPTSDETLDRNTGVNQYVGVNSSVSGITITLPLNANLTAGDTFYIVDETGNANTYNITIATNSNNVNGSASNISITKNYGYIWILFVTASTFIILNQDLT
jgi:hypothetical protein